MVEKTKNLTPPEIMKERKRVVASERKIQEIDIDGPFLVINADDYYGIASFQKLHDYLVSNEDETAYSMVGFVLGNTLTDHGSVARGVCKVEDGKLAGVDERTRIERREGKVQYYENDTWYDVDANSLVSMNMWGFTPKFMEEVEERFPTFLQETVKENPLKSEFYIPVTVDTLIREGKATVTVLSSDDLLATGGTVDATIQIVQELGGEVAGCAFLIELAGLKGREHLKDFNVFSLMSYE